MKEVLTYDDVLLVPQYSDIRSRSEVSLHTDLGNKLSLDFPVIASPMDTVSEADTAAVMSSFGGTAVIHRYNSVEEQVAIAESMITCDGDTVVGAAVGVTGDFLERAQSLFGVGVDFICETKGRANESFPLRYKLFKRWMMDNNDIRTLYKPQTHSECDVTIELILKNRNK